MNALFPALNSPTTTIRNNSSSWRIDVANASRSARAIPNSTSVSRREARSARASVSCASDVASSSRSTISQKLFLADGEQGSRAADVHDAIRQRRRRHQCFTHRVRREVFQGGPGLDDEHLAIFTRQIDFSIG